MTEATHSRILALCGAVTIEAMAAYCDAHGWAWDLGTAIWESGEYVSECGSPWAMVHVKDIDEMWECETSVATDPTEAMAEALLLTVDKVARWKRERAEADAAGDEGRADT